MDTEESSMSVKDSHTLSEENGVLPLTSTNDVSTASTSQETKLIEIPSDNGAQSSDTFKVNTSLIPKAHLEDQANDELLALGLTVFNQDEFEENVMAQVDEAIVKEEEEKRKKILTGQIKASEEDLRFVKQELSRLNKVLLSMKGKAREKEIRKLESVKQQKEKRMKEIKAKLKALHLSVYGHADGLDADEELVQQETQELSVLHQMLTFGKSEQETEQEKMIRTGEMTPFGSVTKPVKEAPKRISLTTESDMSLFDQFLMEKEQATAKTRMSTPVKNKEKSSTATLTTLKKKESYLQDSRFYPNSSKKKKFNRFDEQKKIQAEPSVKANNTPTIKGDDASDSDDSFEERNRYKDCRDGRGYNDSDDDWLPDEPLPMRRGSKRKHPTLKRKKPQKAEDFSCSEDEDEESNRGKCRLAGNASIKRTRDDGNLKYFQSRLKKNHVREEFIKANCEEENSESDSDAEFDGGLKVPKKLWKKLYKYQKTGVRWLWELHCQEAGGIVGDEMGLGKTIQTIVFLAALSNSKLRDANLNYTGLGPCVIVCPTTVMYQWVREFHTWWPLFRVAVLHATGSFTCSEEKLIYSINNYSGILITSYNNLVMHQDHILKHQWHYIILDEGHKIRNPDAQATLACKMFRTPHRVILSGSPIQNNLKELWSLFDFIFPGKLGTLPDFMQHFSVPIVQGGYSNASEIQVKTAYKCACVLRDTIGPYLLRRMKSDVKVNLDLPGKNEQVLFCRLTDEQREVYQEYLDSRECQNILDGRYKVFAGLITLRKICNHPDISTGGPRIYIGEDTKDDETLNYGYWRRSGKMIVVESLLRLWKNQGHRALLFSQSKYLLDIMESFTQDQNYTYLRMDGTTPISSRQILINRYNEDNSIYLFLLTTRVGGLGVNLTGANRIIIYDPDWNPSTDTQARERAWRIGQKKQVTIYRLLTSGTIEEKIYHRQIFKQFLSNRILKDPKQRRFFKSNELHELFILTDNSSNGTETGALFAGTGSEVSVKPKKVNRFDMMKASEETKKVPEKIELSLKQKERMRQLAKKLSQKIGQSKEKKSNSITSDEKAKSSDEACPGQVNGNLFTESEMFEKSIKDKKFHIKTTDEKVRDEPQPGTSGQNFYNHEKDRENGKHKHHHKHKKSKKKKKKKDIYMDGELISNLVKQTDYKPVQNDEEENQAKNSIMDDYVLHRLFKKSGVHSALKHDVVMDASKADYILIEAEADRVAKQAANSLKQVRSASNRALSGIPTWTGQSGGNNKPRFGQKKNSVLASNFIKPTATSSTPPSTPSKDIKHFDGHVSGNQCLLGKQKKSTLAAMSSQELLSRMRKRKLNNELNQDSDPNTFIEPDNIELISEIRNFIAFQCAIDGQATTEELLNEFKARIPPNESAKFKSMLKEICSFFKRNGIGIWRLKGE